MFTALDASSEKLDAQETKFVAQIRNHGWFRSNVFENAEGPGFSYTTGFWFGAGAPEVIVFSLNSGNAHDVLWNVYRRVSEGECFPIGQRLSNIFAGTEAVFLPVSKQFYAEYLGWSRWFYGSDDWSCLQLIWADQNGAFPWEAGYEERFANSQPNLSGLPWPTI